ncbi:chaplin [Streptomyces sp. A3M-1-3]|uniref:chaplin n=1 Tax=Streptomyces sp. A3M-1-3 TaxID=2962044 RepID=UPI0020B6C67A|nr:chaplin [Streptomyces sp. A3M-1-3]MCP3820972.1 chaplin [Streptomyces sp. A3M-1-3]
MITGTALAGAGYAHADSDADGSAVGSPGVLSGNTVQVPVHIPVNVCGNTVNVVGLLNPAVGNNCSNSSHGNKQGKHGNHGKHGEHGEHGGATAEGRGKDSPGVLSGNGVQIPVDVPVNVTGNSVNVVGIGNAAVGNSSSNTPGPRPERPKPVTPPKEEPVRHTPPKDTELANTGTDGLGVAVPTSAALLLGGAMLYRRSRAAARR